MGAIISECDGLLKHILTHGDTHREHGLESCAGLSPNLEVCLLQLRDCLKRLSLGHNRKERGVGGTVKVIICMFVLKLKVICSN